MLQFSQFLQVNISRQFRLLSNSSQSELRRWQGLLDSPSSVLCSDEGRMLMLENICRAPVVQHVTLARCIACLRNFKARHGLVLCLLRLTVYVSLLTIILQCNALRPGGRPSQSYSSEAGCNVVRMLSSVMHVNIYFAISLGYYLGPVHLKKSKDTFRPELQFNFI